MSNSSAYAEAGYIPYKNPDWLFDWKAIDEFYGHLRSTDVSRSHHLRNVVKLSAARARHVIHLKMRFRHWFPDRVLKVSSLQTLTPLQPIPIILLQEPYLSHFWLPDFANLGGIGWILAVKEVAKYPGDRQTAQFALAINIILRTLHSLQRTHSRFEDDLPGFEELTPDQMLIHYLARTWGCGQSRTKSHLPKSQAIRDDLFDQLQKIVRSIWKCQQ